MSEQQHTWQPPPERTTHRIGGKEIELEALTVRDLEQIGYEALKRFRREWLEYYTENADLLCNGQDVSAWLKEKQDEVRRIAISDLPRQSVVVATDQSDSQGKPIMREQFLDYVQWWMSDTFGGLCYTLWLSMRHCPQQSSVTIDDVSRLVTNDLAGRDELEAAAEIVGELSYPNPQSPRHQEKTRRNRRRGRR